MGARPLRAPTKRAAAALPTSARAAYLLEAAAALASAAPVFSGMLCRSAQQVCAEVCARAHAGVHLWAPQVCNERA